MRFQGSFIYRADPLTVYSTFIDREALLEATPGLVSLEETEPDRYEAVLKMGIGGFALVYHGTLILSDKRPGEGYHFLCDATTQNGFGRGEATFRFEPQDGGGTRVVYEADVALGGSQKLLPALARGLVDFFLRGMAEVMRERAEAQAEAEMQAAAPSGTAPGE